MPKGSVYDESYSFENGKFTETQQELLREFFKLVSRRYEISISAETVRYKESRIGLSPVRKLFTSSAKFYPFFIKIGRDDEIQKESKKYGKASSMMPTLSMPPKEAFIHSSKISNRISLPANDSLVAFRSITGRTREEAPNSLFDSYASLSKYQLIEVIDEIFQISLRDLHSFGLDAENREIEYVYHDLNLISRNEFAITTNMAIQYNNLTSKAATPTVPHGYVHGDLHCNNILLGRGNIPVIIDFAMLRKTGCLLCDYAELEVAILVSALSSSFPQTANSARDVYQGKGLLDQFGLDKFSRCVRVIRSNLLNSIYSLGHNKNSISIRDVDFVYQMLLLRYLCSYSWVAHETMEEEVKHSTCALLSEIFNVVYLRVAKMNSNYKRRRPA